MAKRFALKDNKQWLVGVTNHIEILNKSIGFNPIWDSTINEYDQDTLWVGIDNEGYNTEKLIGMRHGHDLDLLIASVIMNFHLLVNYQIEIHLSHALIITQQLTKTHPDLVRFSLNCQQFRQFLFY